MHTEAAQQVSQLSTVWESETNAPSPDSESIMFFWTWDIDNVGQLLEYTTTVYTGKPSIAELIIVNSSLSRLLCECIREEAAPSAQAELKMQAGQCEKNLNTLLSRLPFNLASNFDNILALFQAVSSHILVNERMLC